jgi:hypothetical protein
LDQLKKQEGNENMETITDWSAALTTNCECCYLDEEDNEITPEYCQGYCYEDAMDDCTELLEDWQRLNDYPSAVIIQGRAMGWQRRDGYALIRANGSDKIAAEIISKLQLNGDFTLQFTLKGKACTVRRTSHDELGASFELEAFTACDGWSECQATEGITEHEGQNLCAWCLDIELANN